MFNKKKMCCALTVCVFGNNGFGSRQGVGFSLGVDGPDGECVLTANFKVIDFKSRPRDLACFGPRVGRSNKLFNDVLDRKSSVVFACTPSQPAAGSEMITIFKFLTIFQY